MPQLAITIEGTESILDTDNLMLSELEVLEEYAGVDVQMLNDKKSLESMRMIGHLLWLVQLRAYAARNSVPLTEAAKLHPRAEFDVAVGTLSIRTVPVPKDPSVGTTATRSRRPASSKPRGRSAKSTEPKSESSPSS